MQGDAVLVPVLPQLPPATSIDVAAMLGNAAESFLLRLASPQFSLPAALLSKLASKFARLCLPFDGLVTSGEPWCSLPPQPRTRIRPLWHISEQEKYLSRWVHMPLTWRIGAILSATL